MQVERRSPLLARILLTTFTLTIVLTGAAALADGAGGLDRFPYPADGLKTVPFQTRGDGELDKLSPELRKLYEQYTGDRRNPSDFAYSPEQLAHEFGIAADDPRPLVQVSIILADGETVAALSESGIVVYSVHGGIVMAAVPVPGLLKLARVEAVEKVTVSRSIHTPQPPTRAKVNFAAKLQGFRGEEGKFDTQGLTGDGVIVGVVDSGIDWSHKDFVNPDGSSRILYLWDMLDSSFDDNGVGMEAPVAVDFLGLGLEMRLGTLYTRDMLTAALAGNGTCNSVDVVGHGTACASTAAGNGLATAYGVPAGTYAGLAPEADLMVCRAGDGSFDSDYIKAVEWIADTAASLGRPCVINLSMGGHGSAHDGQSAEELVLNEISARTGAVICVSAGNEGRESFHTSGRFGPRNEGQMDVQSDPVELFVSDTTELHAYFDAEDDWGFAIAGLTSFLAGSDGTPGVVYLQSVDDQLSVQLSDNLADVDLGEWFEAITFSDATNEREVVTVPVMAGSYQVLAYGATWDVPDGSFDFYLPIYFNASFGRGAVQSRMVGSPGNADGVITVGSYDFRNEWMNWQDKTTRYNLELGDISDYSSPGYRTDGEVKPDVVAPGRFTISALAPGSQMAQSGGDAHRTSDGFHLAWEGTSASAPYISGLVALMFEKNPGLTPQQVKDILIRTAGSDRQTGAVPNELWGNGKVDPAAALRATPSS